MQRLYYYLKLNIFCSWEEYIYKKDISHKFARNIKKSVSKTFNKEIDMV